MDAHFDFFRSVIRQVYPALSREALEYYTSLLTVKMMKRKEIFIDVYQVHNEIGFVAEGFIRGFYVNNKGEEITTRIVDKGNFATQYSAFTNRQKSDYTFQCLEDCVLLCFNYDDIQLAYRLYPELEKFGRLIAERIIEILETRARSFQFLSAEERYLDFLNRFPHLMNKISINYLSSYLGVRRPSLSRIRRNIAVR
ncbi:MAG: Crp/Fnr family transcriptional regulator [Bacteroidota bacterium]